MIKCMAIAFLFSLAGGSTVLAGPPRENDGLPSESEAYDYSGLENLVFSDAPDEPEVPLGTVDPSIPRVTTRLSGGRARVRSTAAIRVVVRPRIAFRNLSVRRARLPAGAEFEGEDNNNNGMPDDLERPDVQVLPQ
ncbi:MAG: hypothetical protein J0L52_02400 [Caulobacterales bacterium]|nr:hypothetical protein [Caulobacterales bacterium]